MATPTDRVGELLEGIQRNRRTIVSPEGVPFDIHIASHGERLSALTIDLIFMFLMIGFLHILLIFLFFARENLSVSMTLILFLAFIVRNLYFLHFELAWQGRTPGKKICRLRVINRSGGELSPSSIIARNLTREVEIFLPLSLYISLDASQGVWQQLTLFGWIFAITALPLFNRDHLRAGDLIAGTQVIVMRRRVLLDDLSGETTTTATAAVTVADTPRYSFTHAQLAVYGAFELQVLEEFLRRPATRETQTLLDDVCQKICRKIGWKDMVPKAEVRRFLTDFYTAERAELERAQLFGHFRADKNAEKKKDSPPS